MLAIFDLDGVLVKTDHIHTQALRNSVSVFVSAEASKLPYLDARDGVRTIQKLHRLRDEYSLSDSQCQSIEQMKSALTKLGLRFIERNEEVIRSISYLKDRGWKVAIASNSRREFVELILASLQIDSLLDLVICGDEVINPKPHPAIFLTAMDLLHHDASNTVIFEDSPSGLAAANKTNAKVVQVDPDKLIDLSMIKREINTHL